MKVHLLLYNIIFWYFCLYFDRTVYSNEAKWERGGGRDAGKGHEPGLKLGMPKAQLHYMAIDANIYYC